jgi:nitroreductase
MDTTTMKPAEAIDVIYSRRAVRKFKAKPVDHSLIEKVIDAGRMAPSAMNNQPWHFYVLTNRAMIDKFSKEIAHNALKEVVKSGKQGLKVFAAGLLHLIVHPDWRRLKDPVFYGAPVVVFLTAPVNYQWAGLDIGMCAQNMMLTAKALGLDSCPVGFGKFVNHVKDYELLKVSAEEEVLLAVIIGYGDEMPIIHERKKGNVLFID